MASFETPADAATAVSYLGDWSRAQKALMRVPSSQSEHVEGDREAVLAIFRAGGRDGRRMLTEPEAKAAIAAYGIAVPETVVARTPRAVEKAAARLLESSDKVVVKLLSKAISHKSDIGGVALEHRDRRRGAKKPPRSIEDGSASRRRSRHRRLCRAADGGAQAVPGADPRHQPRSDLRSGRSCSARAASRSRSSTIRRWRCRRSTTCWPAT